MSSEAKGPKIVAECEASGEPYFVIRAKDFFAMSALMRYTEEVHRTGPDNPEFSAELTRLGREFATWRAKNTRKVRYPD